jgi:hypothetical protein
MSTKMKLIALIASICIVVVASTVHANVGFSDVIGKTFISGAGSTSGDFIMSVGITTLTRSTVEVTFVRSDISWFRSDIEVLTKTFKVEDLITVMINCREKTYSPGSFLNGDAIAVRTYRFGNAFKWGNYKTGEVIGNTNDGPALSRYFQTACNYAAKF